MPACRRRPAFRALCALLSLATLSSCTLWRKGPDEHASAPWAKERARGRGESAVKSSIDEVAQVLRLSPAQRKRLKRDGLLVTRSPAAIGSVPSPIYDKIYQHDLPVLITTDSILYAFHRRYVEFLEDLEQEQLHPLLQDILLTTRAELGKQVAKQRLDLPTGIELDVYLTVALRLLGQDLSPVLQETPRQRVDDAISKVFAQKPRDLEIFGDTLKAFDFSHFKPRGHYTHSEKLRSYFRCVMWLGRVRLELISPAGGRLTFNRQRFETAAALSWVIEQSSAKRKLESYLGILDDFVGPADDDTPLSIADMLDKHGVHTRSELNALKDEQILSWLASNATQRSRILSHRHVNPGHSPRSRTPRSFMLIGQRFTFDAHILGELVYDKLVDPKRPEIPIKRFMPKGLDLMAVLGNERAKVHLQAEFERFGYEGALDLLAAGVKAKPSSDWTSNLHSAWLDAIASLHQDPDDPRLPAVFRSPGWKDKTLQTQLASWAELRHDHILYVKQSTTAVEGCEFSDAYVEPVPHVFAKIKQLVSKLHAVTDKLETRGLKVKPQVHDELSHFSHVLDMLYAIADKELRHEPPTKAEMDFLKQAVESESVGYGARRWDGWYPKLLGEQPTNDFDPTIADVHTEPASERNNWRAQILHVGTGRFEIATVAIDCPGQKKCVYVGPVSSYYEFIHKDGKRLTDETWKSMIFRPELEVHRPQWIRSFRDGSDFSELEQRSDKLMLIIEQEGSGRGK